MTSEATTSFSKTRRCHAAQAAIEAAVRQARAGRPRNGIGAAIGRAAATFGLRAIENRGSHGVRRALHDGVTITIEAADGWTLVGALGPRSVRHGHTLIVTRGEPIVATQH